MILNLNELYKEVLKEANVGGKHLVVVDIQPEYEDGFNYWLDDFIEFLNENHQHLGNITFLYNGEDTLGMISENDYRNWWYENGLDEDIASNAHMYDKGYAFFRYCLDEIGAQETTNLVKYMLSQNVHDSRDLDEGFWRGFVEQYGDEDVRELMEHSGDTVWIPDLVDEIKRYNNIVICGGGVNECLKEVEIALDAIDKPYQTIERFTY